MNKKFFLFIIIAIFTIFFLNLSNLNAFGRERKRDKKNIMPYREIKKVTIDSSLLSDSQRLCLDIVSKIDEAEIDTTPPKSTPKYWKTGILTNITLSQVSLTNWAGGGNPNISMNALVNANANYSREKIIFENRLKLSYGFIQNFENGIPFKKQLKKSDDRMLLDSKWGIMIYDRLYFSALLNFRTQFTPTRNNNASPSLLKSTFMAPGYLSAGFGINYKPFQFLSLNISPITGNFVFVTKKELRETYGNKIDQPVRTELGTQFKMDVNYGYKTLKMGTNLILFSDYLNNPQNIQVFWDIDFALNIGKYFIVTLRTNLIYDDNIRISGSGGNNPGRRVQFQEILGLGFTYIFGNYIKG